MKLGFVSMPFDGHLNPMTALARELQSRGHEIVFIGLPDVGPHVRAAGLDFVPYCEEEFPLGSFAAAVAPVSKLHGLKALRWTLEGGGRALFSAASKHLPRVLAETGVEALVLDTIHMYLELVPMSLGMPYAHVWAVLHFDFSGATPPSLFSWPHQDTAEARARNLVGVMQTNNFYGAIGELAADYAKSVGLQVDCSNPATTLSKLAVVAQTPQEFDFPEIPWPPQFHYAGPFVDNTGRQPVPFPWEKLDSRPLVYASLGTLVNGMESIYRAILSAVGKLPEVQVVLSKGRNIELADLGDIPPNVIVVEKAPQLELLKRAALCITHAGLNTALESLSQGVPMVAIPVSYDQPGVAARIAYYGVGEFLEIDSLSPDGLHRLVRKVLNTPSYREKALRFKNIIAERRGLDIAAEAIESAFEKAIASRPADFSFA
jgi:zeaxanthin glucosyltransferase